MDQNNELLFPFGDKRFIGMMYSYNILKGAGRIYSNNYGMQSFDQFNSISVKFNVYDSSWEKKRIINIHKPFVFRPAVNIKNETLQAEDVRIVNLEIDRNMVLDYFEHNNCILYEEEGIVHIDYKVRRTTITKVFDILIECGMSRNQFINEYIEKFRKSHDFKMLLDDLNIIIQSVNGEEKYYHLLNDKKNKEKGDDYIVLKSLFSLLTKSEIREVILKHPSLQMFAPEDVLMEELENITDWGVPVSVKKALCIIEERKYIEKLIDQRLPNTSRNKMEDIKIKYADALSPERMSILIDCIDNETMVYIKSLFENLFPQIIPSFISIAGKIDQEYNHLSDKGKNDFYDLYCNKYEIKILKVVENALSLEWNNSLRNDVLQFILTDIIIVENGIKSPCQKYKEGIIRDYEKLFIQSDDEENPFTFYYQFDEVYKCLFDEEEHNALITTIEKNV